RRLCASRAGRAGQDRRRVLGRRGIRVLVARRVDPSADRVAVVRVPPAAGARAPAPLARGAPPSGRGGPRAARVGRRVDDEGPRRREGERGAVGLVGGEDRGRSGGTGRRRRSRWSASWPWAGSCASSAAAGGGSTPSQSARSRGTCSARS